jgi:hypothetical protein
MNQLEQAPVAPQRYANVMTLVKARLIEVRRLLSNDLDVFSLEIIGNHFRKIVEAVAYSALIACEMEFDQVPRQIRNQWNASGILTFLSEKNLLNLPKRAVIQDAPSGSGSHYTVYDGTDELLPWLLNVYEQVHFFAHEPNPYSQWRYYAGLSNSFLSEQRDIAIGLQKHLQEWLWQHVIQVREKWYVVRLGLEDSSSAVVEGIPLPTLVNDQPRS